PLIYILCNIRYQHDRIFLWIYSIPMLKVEIELYHIADNLLSAQPGGFQHDISRRLINVYPEEHPLFSILRESMVDAIWATCFGIFPSFLPSRLGKFFRESINSAEWRWYWPSLFRRKLSDFMHIYLNVSSRFFPLPD